MEHWSPVAYTVDDGSEGGEVHCVIRGNPASFNQRSVKCDVVSEADANITYGDQEELISKVVEVKPVNDDTQAPLEPIFVAIPYVARLPASREPVIKAFVDEHWEDLPTQEVVLDGYKEFRFAQAKVSQYSKVLVMSRFKRDYLQVQHPKRMIKLTSSYDQRVALTIPKNTFTEKENLILQVQPVDSNTVSEFRAMDPSHKSLLTSSPILHMEWQTQQFANPINITVPCPPNPAKAKKLAMLKKQKEEKLQAPKPAINVDELLKGKESKPKPDANRGQQKKETNADDETQAETKPQKATKWYMGQYGQTEDDENDKLCLLACSGGRWTYQPEVKVTSVKLDLVAFDLDVPFDKVVVFRTRVDVEDDFLKQMVKGLTELLARRFVKIMIKQRADDPYDVCCNVVHTSFLDRAEKQMKADGYTEGPDKYQSASIREGDTLILHLRGNLKFQYREEPEIKMVYNSNLPTQANFTVTEVDRYLQRNYEVYRGAVRVVRRYSMLPNPKMRRAADEDPTVPIVKNEILCDVDIEIPKYHVEPDPIPRRVSVVIHDAGPVDKDTLQQLAADLGEEWQRLGDKLHVTRVRQQAILRRAQATGAGEERAKYDMLMTWFKRCPQAADKVSTLASALLAVGRDDLASQLRARGFHHRQSIAPTSPITKGKGKRGSVMKKSSKNNVSYKIPE